MVKILDQNGHPIRTQDLKQPQTRQDARFARLHREFAEHPSRGLTPAKLASILRAAEDGDLVAQHELFVDMEEKDGHIYAEMQKRRMAVSGLDWSVQPPRNPSAAEKKQAAYLEELIRDIPDIEDVVYDIADAVGHGFACLEYEWRQFGREWLPNAITHRPQTWFTVDRETRSEIRLRADTLDGEPLQPFGWIVHVHRAKSGYLARAGLHRVLAWPFLFKNYSVRDLAEFLEIYGLPARIGKYPAGASDAEKATLLKAVLSIGHNAAGIIPEGMALEFLDAAQGTSDPFETMIAWCERTQSKAILGGTLTAEPGSVGSRSLGEVHNEVRVEIRNHDARQIGGSLTRFLVYPLAVLNTQGVANPRRCPKFVFDTGEPEDLKLYAESLPRLVDYGARIPVNWMHDKLRIPQPEDDEPVMQPQPPAKPQPAAVPGEGQPGGDASAAAKTDLSGCPVCAARTGADDNDPLDDLRELALDGWQEQVRPLTNPIVQAIADAQRNGETLDQVRSRIAGLLDTMDVSSLTEALAQAAFVARIAGEAGVDINER